MQRGGALLSRGEMDCFRRTVLPRARQSPPTGVLASPGYEWHEPAESAGGGIFAPKGVLLEVIGGASGFRPFSLGANGTCMIYSLAATGQML